MSQVRNRDAGAGLQSKRGDGKKLSSTAFAFVEHEHSPVELEGTARPTTIEAARPLGVYARNSRYDPRELDALAAKLEADCSFENIKTIEAEGRFDFKTIFDVNMNLSKSIALPSNPYPNLDHSATKACIAVESAGGIFANSWSKGGDLHLNMQSIKALTVRSNDDGELKILGDDDEWLEAMRDQTQHEFWEETLGMKLDRQIANDLFGEEVGSGTVEVSFDDITGDLIVDWDDPENKKTFWGRLNAEGALLTDAGALKDFAAAMSTGANLAEKSLKLENMIGAARKVAIWSNDAPSGRNQWRNARITNSQEFVIARDETQREVEAMGASFSTRIGSTVASVSTDSYWAELRVGPDGGSAFVVNGAPVVELKESMRKAYRLLTVLEKCRDKMAALAEGTANHLG